MRWNLRIPLTLAGALAAATLGAPASVSAAPAAAVQVVSAAQAAVVSTSSSSEDVLFRGTDSSLQHAYTRDGGVTYHRDSLGGLITSEPGAVVQAGTSPRIDVFVRGTNGYLYQKYYSAGWSEYKYLGAQMAGSPSAVSWAPGRLDVFYVAPHGNLGHGWYDGAWHFQSLITPGVTVRGHPAAVSYTSGALDVFYRGSDDALHHAYYNSTSGGWQYVSLGGGMVGDPAVAVQTSAGSPVQMRVYIHGTNGAPYVNSLSGTTSSGYTGLAGLLGSDPVATSWSGRFDLLGSGTDGYMYQWTSTGSGYSSPRRAAGPLNGTPAAIVPATGRIDVYYRGPNNALLHVAYTASTNTWTTPQYLGNGFAS